MPNAILILLIIAGIGILGSIALIVLTAVLGSKASKNEDAFEEDAWEEDEPTDIEDEYTEKEAASADAEEVIFTPLEPAHRELSEEEQGMEAAESAQPVYEEEPTLQLADIAEAAKANYAVVGNLSVSIGNAQDIGARLEQQDAFAITPLEEQAVVESRGVMAVVCDGMGGMDFGAQAANLGAVTFMRNYLEAQTVDNNTLVDAVYSANAAVYDNHQGKDGVIAGTTLVAASVQPDGLRFVSVGDSHVYLYRNGKLYQLNRDHNYFSELLEQVKAGTITLEEAQRHPERAHLTSYVGIEALQLVDYNVEPVELRVGDRVLLCSDGLFKTLSIREIAEVMANAEESEMQTALMEAVKAKGKRKQDNTTIVVLYCDGVA